MITVNSEPQLITITVFGEFTIADFQEFESAALAALAANQKPNLLFDLREMSGYTVDVAWEEIRFGREHANDFSKIAVVTNDQWVIWSAWLSQLFVESDLQVSEEVADALEWLNENSE